MGAKKEIRPSLLARNNALGKSSPKNKMKRVDIKVSNNNLKISTHACGMEVFFIKNSHKGESVSPTSKPNITRNILKPISVAAINRDGCSRKREMMRLLLMPCFFLSSMVSLLALTNATSIPVKKMIITHAIMIHIRVLVLIMQLRI